MERFIPIFIGLFVVWQINYWTLRFRAQRMEEEDRQHKRWLSTEALRQQQAEAQQPSATLPD
jgi:hypothetical protein